jgi:hypothetical protein
LCGSQTYPVQVWDYGGLFCTGFKVNIKEVR